MNKKKLFGYVMAGALSLGVIGAAGVPAFAQANSTSNSSTTTEQAVNVKASLDDETKQKVQAIMDELKTGLSDLGVALPTKGERSEMFANLDDAMKEKAQAIIEQLKTDTITKEEAQSQLADLGVELPVKGNKGDRSNLFAGLDDETKEKAQAIMEQKKAGTITGEEAQAQLAELDVELPAKVDRGNLFAGLDDETKEKAQAIMEQKKAGTITGEEAQSQLAELGVELPAKEDKGKLDDLLADLDAATKEKAQTLIDKAKAQLTELGVNHFHFKGLGNSTTEE